MTILEDLTELAKVVTQAIVGLILMLAGLGYIVWEKTTPPTHDVHLAGALVVALLGAAIIPSVGPVLTNSLKSIVGVLVSALPSRPEPPKP